MIGDDLVIQGRRLIVLSVRGATDIVQGAAQPNALVAHLRATYGEQWQSVYWEATARNESGKTEKIHYAADIEVRRAE